MFAVNVEYSKQDVKTASQYGRKPAFIFRWGEVANSSISSCMLLMLATERPKP
jgi:hypothetical protein